MSRHHVIQISDLHLSGERAYNHRGWRACLDHIGRERPDFVAVTGDLVLDDPDHGPDHAFVRSELDRIPVPWSALPGNHDVGDTNPEPYMGQHFDPDRHRRYLDHFGQDRWLRELDRWLLIGLNAQLLGSDTPAEAEQSAWLADVLAADRARPTALFLHKPLCVSSLKEASNPDPCVIAEGRDRLLQIIAGVGVRLIASGHNHHYRTLSVGALTMVWAPSTAQIFHMPRQFRALPCPGAVHYWFDGEDVEFGLVVPPGLVVNDVTPLIGEYGAMRHAPPLPVDQPAHA
jgi:3',5'-cyclic AMP phosphodiesterase CpdA